MIGRRRTRGFLPLLAATCGLLGWAMPSHGDAPVSIRYVGSSTVANFLRDAEPVYRGARFEIDTQPESAGGERAIVEGRTDLGGIADQPRPETLRLGVASTLIGRDAIAVVVNAKNPVTTLPLADLKAIFTGKLRNWKDVGGPDLLVQPFIVAAESATRKVFRTTVLGEQDYAGCEEITPDRDILAAVARTPGGVGQISFSFLNGATGVRTVSIEGEEPSVTNFDYPIGRPLYLLWREGKPEVEAFVEWTRTEEGQRVVMQRFVGVRVVGSVREAPEKAATGTLIVYTETYSVYDGGIYYYPHRGYEILTRHGAFLRRVENHRGDNDESPMKIDLPPGTYLVRPDTSRGTSPEFFVTIAPGKTTEFSVEELLKGRK